MSYNNSIPQDSDNPQKNLDTVHWLEKKELSPETKKALALELSRMNADDCMDELDEFLSDLWSPGDFH